MRHPFRPPDGNSTAVHAVLHAICCACLRRFPTFPYQQGEIRPTPDAQLAPGSAFAARSPRASQARALSESPSRNLAAKADPAHSNYLEIWRDWRLGDLETWKRGDLETCFNSSHQQGLVMNRMKRLCRVNAPSQAGRTGWTPPSLELPVSTNACSCHCRSSAGTATRSFVHCAQVYPEVLVNKFDKKVLLKKIKKQMKAGHPMKSCTKNHKNQPMGLPFVHTSRFQLTH